MKKFIKTLMVTFALVLAFSVTACKAGGVEKIDKTKTQIYVSHFNGGYGDAWLQKIKTDFEADYATVSFEEGKTGVQVVIENHKDVGSGLTQTMRGEDAYVWILEDVPYNEYIAVNNLYDITDVVNGTFDINDVAGHENTPDVTDKDIIGKFNDIQKTSLKINDKYYGIPHYEGYYGLTFDADLFNQKKYFLGGANNVPSYDESDKSVLSAGPDGVKGTYDDGLPATYDEFFDLCARMEGDRITPVIWSGENQFYISNTINQLVADYHGYANEQLAYTFSGTSTEFITSWSGNTPVIGSKPITNANGYDVFGQAGYYYGLKWLEDLIDADEYVHDDSFTSSFSHTDAQNNYLLSRFATGQTTPIAMIAEGVWWANEASAQFRAMASQFPGSGAMERDLRWMPLPKADEEHIGKTTLLESQNSFMMIRENVDEKYIPLSKLFLQYCNEEKRLQEFSVISNTPKALIYDMPEDKLNQMTPLGRSIMRMKTAEVEGERYTDVVYQLSTNTLYANNKSKFRRYSVLATADYEYPSTAMNSRGISAQDYFTSLHSYWRSRWGNEFSQYI